MDNLKIPLHFKEKNKIEVYDFLKFLCELQQERTPIYNLNTNELKLNMEYVLAQKITPNTPKNNSFKRF